VQRVRARGYVHAPLEHQHTGAWSDAVVHGYARIRCTPVSDEQSNPSQGKPWDDDVVQLIRPLGPPATQNQIEGLNIVIAGHVHHVEGGVFQVGQGADAPIINPFGDVPTCNSEDWMKRSNRTLGHGYYCRHLCAVAYVVHGVDKDLPPSDDWGVRFDDDEKPTPGRIYKPKRTERTAGGYKRKPEYDQALRSEFGDVLNFILAVTRDINVRRSISPNGRTPFDMSQMLLASLIHAYFNRSYRFTESFLDFLHDFRVIPANYPQFALLGEFIRDRDTTPHLRRLLRETGVWSAPCSNFIYGMDMRGVGRDKRFDYRLQQRLGKEGKRDKPIRLMPDDGLDALPLSAEEINAKGPLINPNNGKIRKGYYRVSPLIDVDLMVTIALAVTDHRVHESRVAARLIMGLLSAYARPYDPYDDMRQLPENPTVDEMLKALEEGKFEERFDLEQPPKLLGDGGYSAGKLRQLVYKLGGLLYAPYPVNQKNFEPGLLATLHAKAVENPRKIHEILRYRVKVECHNSSTDAIFDSYVRSVEGAGPENIIISQYCLQNMRFGAMAARAYNISIPSYTADLRASLDDEYRSA